MAGQKILNRRDTADSATITEHALNSSTDVKIRDAGTAVVNVIFSNPSNQDVFLKYQAQGLDTDKKGVFLGAKDNIALVFGNGFYTGEVSAQSKAGNPTISTTEF